MPRSAYFNFREVGGGGGGTAKSKPKCQDLPKIQFGGGGAGVGSANQNSKCQDLHKFEFFWGGAGGRGLGVLPTQNKASMEGWGWGSAKSTLKLPRSA